MDMENMMEMVGDEGNNEISVIKGIILNFTDNTL